MTVAASFAAKCASSAVGESVVGTSGWIEYSPGDSPLILAAPHGGRKQSSDFPLRNSGVVTTDANSDQLAVAICSAMTSTGRRPHLIVCHLPRKYLDANRPLDAACPPESPAVAIWNEYQAAILSAKQRVLDLHGRGLFVEVHGHGHSIPRLELGYLLRERDFELPLADFNHLASRSSIQELVSRGQNDLHELVRGKSSLGSLLEEQGMAAVPSPSVHSPGKNPYFNGGWNTLMHGSRNGGTISSIQIECYREGLRDSNRNIQVGAQKIAAALSQFIELHYR
jgi:hypothetical protein